MGVRENAVVSGKKPFPRFPVRSKPFPQSPLLSISSKGLSSSDMKTKTHVLFSLIFILFLLNGLDVLNGAKDEAVKILLNCGSSDNESVDADGRKWSSDSTSKFLLSPENSITAKAEFQDPSLPSPVPYMTARAFTKESTYRFAVTAGKRHWLRLHFYPSKYGSLNVADSYFSVVANGITLLHNFSVAITAQALTQAFIVREFSLNPASNDLNVTFAPSDKHRASYAFVNGIEVISTPDVFSSSAVMVGFSDQSVEIGSSTIQTMYRLNVGGKYISTVDDSGLSRTWYDDSPYIYGAGLGVTSDAGKEVKIQYSEETPAYIAPVDVYSTARTMGPDSNLNKNYNLTWIFQVDANFTYTVRLHFCELQMTKVNQRVFDIYLNNQTAKKSADVIAWSRSKGVPVYNDYAVYVNDMAGDEELAVALHPSVSAKPEYLNAILNGLEIFKLSDAAGNLAGPNPVPSPMLVAAEANAVSYQSKPNWKRIVIKSAAGGAGVGLLFAIFIVVYRRRKGAAGGESGCGSSWLPVYVNSHTTASRSTCSSSNLSAKGTSLCRHFSFADIKNGTKNFDESLVIGVGGFGKVYRGVIDGGTKVAIKRANPSSEQGIHEFRTEIELLSKLRHRHLVSLIGCCEENNEMILVYDYMAHGTLREHLYNCDKAPLSWKQRLEICIGAARGLHYLHTGAKQTIIHRDVKTTNILVDEKWVAKVSDFGLSKTGPSVNQTHVSTVVKGSFGYLDPEYYRTQQLTDKSDVYSFGVVLFEALCGRAALNLSLPKEQVSLAEWALHCRSSGTLMDAIDPHIKGEINPECLKKFADTAEKCLADHGTDRPSMGDVLWNLEFALLLQENPEGRKLIEN